MTDIRVGNAERYTVDEAREVIAGYAFCEDNALAFTDVHPPYYFRRPSATTRRVWAYRSYDCIPGGRSHRLEPIDILVVAGLNGRLDSDKVISILAVEPELSEALEHLATAPAFWNLDRAHLRSDVVPPIGNPEWWLCRAWWLLMGAPEVGVAVAHKLLHHKVPSIAPLIDGLTSKFLGPSNWWVQIHEELTEQTAEFDKLEGWFADLADHLSGVPLTRLRLHDILLWCEAAGQRDDARKCGRAVLASLDSGRR